MREEQGRMQAALSMGIEAPNSIMKSASIVAVVLDTEFGDRLVELRPGNPVWMVDSAANRAAAQKLWANRPISSHMEGVTIFKVDSSRPVETWLAQALSDIDLHHGKYSQDPPYDTVEVLGAKLTPTIRRAFEACGFSRFVER